MPHRLSIRVAVALLLGTALLASSLAVPSASAATSPKARTAGTSPVRFDSHRVAAPSGYVQISSRPATAGKPAVAPAAIPIYYISPTNYGFLSGIHACRSVVNHSGTQGVICADLYATPYGSTGVQIDPVQESFCNAGSSYPECYEVVVNFELGQGNGSVSPVSHFFCASWEPPSCASGTRNKTGGDNSVAIVQGCNPNPGTANEAWSVILTDSQVGLSSQYYGIIQPNLGSQHAIVCPG
jgi:hypothetical protein